MKELILSWVEPEYEGYLRPWPELRYANDAVAVTIVSEEQFVPWKAACSDHTPLSILMFDYRTNPPKKIKVKAEFESLVHVKMWTKNFLKEYPHHAPKNYWRVPHDKKSIPQPVRYELSDMRVEEGIPE